MVDQPSACNSILGLPTLYAINIKATTFVYHYSIKFHTEIGIKVVRVDWKGAWECYKIAWKKEDSHFKLKS